MYFLHYLDVLFTLQLLRHGQVQLGHQTDRARSGSKRGGSEQVYYNISPEDAHKVMKPVWQERTGSIDPQRLDMMMRNSSAASSWNGMPFSSTRVPVENDDRSSTYQNSVASGRVSAGPDYHNLHAHAQQPLSNAARAPISTPRDHAAAAIGFGRPTGGTFVTGNNPLPIFADPVETDFILNSHATTNNYVNIPTSSSMVYPGQGSNRKMYVAAPYKAICGGNSCTGQDCPPGGYKSSQSQPLSQQSSPAQRRTSSQAMSPNTAQSYSQSGSPSSQLGSGSVGSPLSQQSSCSQMASPQSQHGVSESSSYWHDSSQSMFSPSQPLPCSPQSVVQSGALFGSPVGPMISTVHPAAGSRNVPSPYSASTELSSPGSFYMSESSNSKTVDGFGPQDVTTCKSLFKSL